MSCSPGHTGAQRFVMAPVGLTQKFPENWISGFGQFWGSQLGSPSCLGSEPHLHEVPAGWVGGSPGQHHTLIFEATQEVVSPCARLCRPFRFPVPHTGSCLVLEVLLWRQLSFPIPASVPAPRGQALFLRTILRGVEEGLASLVVLSPPGSGFRWTCEASHPPPALPPSALGAPGV